MDNNDWMQSISSRDGATPEDVATGEQIVQHGATLPAEFAESDRVQRLVDLDVLEVRPARGGDGFEYRKIVHTLNARWPITQQRQ